MHWTCLKPGASQSPKSCPSLWRLLAVSSLDTMPGNGTARTRRLSSEGDSGQLPLSGLGLRNSVLTGGHFFLGGDLDPGLLSFHLVFHGKRRAR